MHCLCYPDKKTDIGRGLGCELMLHLTRTLLQKSAATTFPYQISASSSPCFSFINSGQIRSRNWSPGRLLSFFFSSSSCHISSLSWLWLRGCTPCNAEESVEEQLCLTQPNALQGGTCAESPGTPWAGAGCSQGRSRLASLALTGSVCWSLDHGGWCAWREARIPLAPSIYHSPSPRESDVPSTGFINTQFLSGIDASPREPRGGTHEGTQSMGSVTGSGSHPCGGEGKAERGGCKIFPGHKRVAWGGTYSGKYHISRLEKALIICIFLIPARSASAGI